MLNDLSSLAERLPLIVREEPIARPALGAGTMTEQDIPVMPEDSLSEYSVELRNKNLFDANLTQYEDELQYALYNSMTIWPEALPDSFDPQLIMELGRNPGLGIRFLHDQGIDGSGVNIAIIDGPLIVDHIEYQENLVFYERLNCLGTIAAMHGAGVTSIAVGQTTGVAPGAKVFYIATTFGYRDEEANLQDSVENMGECINRVLEINEHLPESERIRVISISRGFTPSTEGYDAAKAAITAAKAQGILVVTPSIMETYGYGLIGLGRDILDDPDDMDSYQPGIFWYDNEVFLTAKYPRALYVPMDSRTVAAMEDQEDYMFSTNNGMSWACPWLAGMYALCLQVNPILDFGQFLELAYTTGDDLTVPYGDHELVLSRVINPAELIAKLEELP